MKAIDTNVLVRFLVRDDEKQSELVYKLFKRAQSVKKELFVPLIVVLETIWVLGSVYEIPREKIIDSVKSLLGLPVLKFEARSAILGFVSSAQKTKTDLSDLLIGHSAKFSGCESVLNFDKRASGFGLFQLLDEESGRP
ncbi:MAG: type II toxin-antitoxin system VapC family toxin [Deltaproteobacteria bacterium]|nr:type II toxin-antitoxin system VapC family toxin [Deltaproteobacteria bacterium]